MAFDPQSTSTSNRLMAYWLFFCAGLVFGIVVVGGATRLTESGLSMVDWSLLHYKPPSSEDDWISYFEKYKSTPELNNEMTLQEFQKIYHMEYGHRMLGRLIGVVFTIPMVYFLVTQRRVLSKATKISLGVIGCLILFQGFLGWYMVKSGLDPEIVEKKEIPRVSHYRLAAHFTTAVAIYLLMLRTAFSLLNPMIATEFKQNLAAVRPLFSKLQSRLNGAIHLIALTAVSGAFVAGLDAGLIYNTFPKMGLHWIPDDLFSPENYFFDNPTAVQFIHRILAISSFVYVSGTWIYNRASVLPKIHNSLCRKTLSRALNLFLVAGVAQVGLGISTLLWIVPIPLAVLHQAGALILLSCGSWSLYLLKRLR